MRLAGKCCFGPSFSLLFALACSDGGGSGGGGPTAPITVANAEALAGAVVRAVESSVVLPWAVRNAMPSDPGALLPDYAIPGREIPAAHVRTAFGPVSEPCLVSGSVEFQGDVATPGTYSPGDMILADYMACVPGILFQFDGLLDLTVDSVGGSPGSGDFVRLEAVFERLHTGIFIVDGSAMIDVDGPDGTYGATGSSLMIQENGGSHELLDFTTELRFYTARLQRHEFSTDGWMTSTEFMGSVSYTTTRVLDGVGSGFPGWELASQGQLRIDGLSNARLWLEPGISDAVDLRLDLNGDDTVDALVETTWDALLVR
jgi:hypothetical protein